MNSKRITAKPARRGFVSMCACTEPVRTGIGALSVEYGRPKWPTTMLNKQTSLVQKNYFYFYFWHPTLVRPARKRLFCLKAKNGLGRFAPSALPHYDTGIHLDTYVRTMISPFYFCLRYLYEYTICSSYRVLSSVFNVFSYRGNLPLQS